MGAHELLGDAELERGHRGIIGDARELLEATGTDQPAGGDAIGALLLQIVGSDVAMFEVDDLMGDRSALDVGVEIGTHEDG